MVARAWLFAFSFSRSVLEAPATRDTTSGPGRPRTNSLRTGPCLRVQRLKRCILHQSALLDTGATCDAAFRPGCPRLARVRVAIALFLLVALSPRFHSSTTSLRALTPRRPLFTNFNQARLKSKIKNLHFEWILSDPSFFLSAFGASLDPSITSRRAFRPGRPSRFHITVPCHRFRSTLSRLQTFAARDATVTPVRPLNNSN